MVETMARLKDSPKVEMRALRRADSKAGPEAALKALEKAQIKVGMLV